MPEYFGGFAVSRQGWMTWWFGPHNYTCVNCDGATDVRYRVWAYRAEYPSDFIRDLCYGCAVALAQSLDAQDRAAHRAEARARYQRGMSGS